MREHRVLGHEKDEAPTGATAVLVGRQPYGARVQLSVRLPPEPDRGAAAGVGAGVRVCAGGVQRRGRRPPGCARGRGAVPDRRGVVHGAHRGKATPERAWLAEVSAVVLQQALADAEHRLPQLLRLADGQAQGPQGGPAAVPVAQGPSAVDPVHPHRPVHAPEATVGCGCRRSATCRCAGRRDLPGAPSSVTVTVDATGRYHASFVVDGARRPAAAHRPRWDRPGADALRGAVRRAEGRQPAVAPEGRAKLRRAQKDLSRASAGRRTGRSPPQGRPLPRPGRRHPPGLAAQAVDHDHPRQPSGVRGGSARVRSGPHQARQVGARCGLGDFVGMLEYKAARYGRTFAEVDRWFPSTRMCSACGGSADAKPLHVPGVDLPVRSRPRPGRERGARNMLAAGRADSPTPVELVSDGTWFRNRP